MDYLESERSNSAHKTQKINSASFLAKSEGSSSHDENSMTCDMEFRHLDIKTPECKRSQQQASRRVAIKLSDDSEDDFEFTMSPLYCSELNDCVDEILDNKQNFKYMMKQLASRLKVSIKEIESKHMVRHRSSKKKLDF